LTKIVKLQESAICDSKSILLTLLFVFILNVLYSQDLMLFAACRGNTAKQDKSINENIIFLV